MPAMLIGFVAGIVCFLALGLKCRFKFDDALDVIGVHLVGGLVGSLLLGLFADPAVNPAVTHDGLFFGGGARAARGQALAAVVTLVFSFIVVVHHGQGDRPDHGPAGHEDGEDEGMDLGLHAETRRTPTAHRSLAGSDERGHRMKLITAIVKPFKLDDVKEALKAVGRARA